METKFKKKTRRFMITRDKKSPRGYRIAKDCSYGVQENESTPEEIGDYFKRVISNTLKNMDCNNATEIEIIFTWN